MNDYNPKELMSMQKSTAVFLKMLNGPGRWVKQGGWLVVLSWLLLAGAANAQTARHLDMVEMLKLDMRAWAMGDAFGPVARGESALVYNPAGLAQYDEDFKLEYPIIVSAEAGGFRTDMQEQLASTPTVPQLTAFLEKYLGTSQHYALQTSPNAVFSFGSMNLGFGATKIDQIRYTLEFADLGTAGFDLTDDKLYLNKEILTATIMGIAFAFKDSQVLMGITQKSLNYETQWMDETFGTIIGNGSVTGLPRTTYSYTGSAYDVGMIYRMESFSFFRPQWSVNVFNVGGLTYNTSSAGAPALETPATVNTGIAMSPTVGPFKLLLSAELEDVSKKLKIYNRISGLSNVRSTKQRLHLGAELGFFKIATGNHLANVRWGINRGLNTYGLELNVWHGTRLVYTKFQTDLGDETQSKNHAHDGILLSIGFGF